LEGAGYEDEEDAFLGEGYEAAEGAGEVEQWSWRWIILGMSLRGAGMGGIGVYGSVDEGGGMLPLPTTFLEVSGAVLVARSNIYVSSNGSNSVRYTVNSGYVFRM
jgi:hypothetical protein